MGEKCTYEKKRGGEGGRYLVFVESRQTTRTSSFNVKATAPPLGKTGVLTGVKSET